MERRLVIEAYPWETRVGITEDGRLVEVFWENPHATVGKIFTGIVRDIVPGLSCAFVDIGLSRNAFLFVGDTLHQGRRQELRIQEVLKRGQPVLVQVKKEPSGDKGARVTQEISLPGNHLVLLPHQDGVYVSRKITDSQGRAELKRQLEAAKPPGMGVIARTTSGDASREELLAELQALVAEWLRIVAEARQGGPPRMVYGDVGVIERCLREYLDSSTRDIVTNDEGALATVQQVLAAHPPVPALTVRLEPGELFARYGLEKEIKRALQPRVWLKHGGYLVIEETEAMTIIDVNTGRYTGQDQLADTVLKTNLDAAREIPRQLRLRRIGGIVLVDFIDMSSREHQEMVVQRLRAELNRDKAHTRVLGLTRLGLLEMTRRKSRFGLGQLLEEPCTCCGGSGTVPSLSAVCNDIKRRLAAMGHLQGHTLVCVAHPEVVAALRENEEDLAYIAARLGKQVRLQEDREAARDDFRVTTG